MLATTSSALFNLSGIVGPVIVQVQSVLLPALTIGSSVIGLTLAWKVVRRFAGVGGDDIDAYYEREGARLGVSAYEIEAQKSWARGDGSSWLDEGDGGGE